MAEAENRHTPLARRVRRLSGFSSRSRREYVTIAAARISHEPHASHDPFRSGDRLRRGTGPGAPRQSGPEGLHEALQRQGSERVARPAGDLQSVRAGQAHARRAQGQAGGVERGARPALERGQGEGGDRLRRPERAPRHRQGVRRFRAVGRLADGERRRRLGHLPAEHSSSPDLGPRQPRASRKTAPTGAPAPCGTTTRTTRASGRSSRPTTRSARGTRSRSR